MGSYVSWTVEEGIALITLDAREESVNVLNGDFLGELEEAARALRSEKEVQAAVVSSAKEKGFIAGADIHEIEGVENAAEGAALARKGQQIFALWNALPFPVVAAIHGHCLGGGTEFALACHYRIAAEDATVGLPEVKLGILPGFGGTQRLPRLISIEKTLGIILTGRTVKAGEAERIGLVDRLVPADGLRHEATVLAREAAIDSRHLDRARKRKNKGLRAWLLEKNPLGRSFLFKKARHDTAGKTGGNYPAPLRALEVIRKGLEVSIEEGLRIEAEALGQLIVTPECKNLIHVYLLSRRPKKGAGVKCHPREIHRAAVLGAGVMGGGIAQLLAARGIPVLLKDLREEAVEAGLEQARKIFRQQAEKRGGDPDKVAEKMNRITGSTEYGQIGEADMVVEAVVEKMSVKQAVLQEVEPLLKESAVFATNTSALSVSELQSVSERPGNVGGMHFFNPVHRMPLVEIIRGEKTDDQTIATLFAAARNLGKTPIVVTDRPGFLVNRLLVAYLIEACLLTESGVSWQTIDHRAEEFGMPMGPFRLIDEVGIDIATEVGRTLTRAFSHLRKSPFLDRLAESDLLGKKGGLGFYRYEKKKREEPNPDIEQVLGAHSSRNASEDDWRRLLLVMVNEAARCLDEGIVAHPEDIDTGVVFGTGFPPFRGGLCRWADSQGLPDLVKEMDALSARLGERFVPAGFVKTREGFYTDRVHTGRFE